MNQDTIDSVTDVNEIITHGPEGQMFAPNTTYYTKISGDGIPVNWKEKNYWVFKSNEFRNLKEQQFELVDVVKDNNYIITFNQFDILGDSIKHTILDTLVNFSGFPDSIEHSTSVGVMHKDELVGLNLKDIPKESIISVIKDNTSLKEDIKSAIEAHKKEKGHPFGVIRVKRNVTILKAWFANMETKKIELLELSK